MGKAAMRNHVLIRIIALGLALTAGTSAWAHRGHGHRRAHVDLFVGVPLGGSWYAGPPYYRQAPLIVAPPVAWEPVAPPVYIEQNQEAAPDVQGQQDSWWYYCPAQRAYYPYVKTCPQGWQRVAPQPPDLR
jgi:hypothetical protein